MCIRLESGARLRCIPGGTGNSKSTYGTLLRQESQGMVLIERKEKKGPEQNRHLPGNQHKFKNISYLFSGADTALYIAEHASFDKSSESKSGPTIEHLLQSRTVAFVLFMSIKRRLGVGNDATCYKTGHRLGCNAGWSRAFCAFGGLVYIPCWQR